MSAHMHDGRICCGDSHNRSLLCARARLQHRAACRL